MANLRVYAPNHTVQFTWTCSFGQPDAAPTFGVYGTASTVIASGTAITSGAQAFYALYTMPTSEGNYLGEWIATRTIGGSAYQVRHYESWEVMVPDRVRR